MKQIIGYCSVDSGQLLITDPCYLEDWKSDEFDGKENPAEHAFHNKIDRSYSYNGACHTTMTRAMGGELWHEKNENAGVAVSTGYGDGLYPVEATYKDGRVKEIKIKFF